MAEPNSSLHLEGASDSVHDPVAPHLVHKLHGHLRRQQHTAGHHVQVQDLGLAPALCERRQHLHGHGPVPEEELHGGRPEYDVDLLVGVGEVGHERHVAIEVGRRVDVDAVEAGVGGVEGGRPRLDRQEDDQDDHASHDQDDAEGEADDGRKPHRRRGPVTRLKNYLRRSCR